MRSPRTRSSRGSRTSNTIRSCVGVHEPAKLASARDALRERGVKIADAYLGMRAKTKIALQGDALTRGTRLLEALDEHEDVQRVFSNLDVSDVSLEALA